MFLGFINLGKRNIIKNVKDGKYYKAKEPIYVEYKIINEKSGTISSGIGRGLIKDISISGIRLKTNTMQINGMHISHDRSMLNRNLLEIKIYLNGGNSVVKARGYVSFCDFSRDNSNFQYEVGITYSKIMNGGTNKLKKFLMKLA